MGLSVLVCRPTNKSSFGGKGVTISEVLNYLRSTSPKINYSRASTSYGHGASTATIKLREGNSIFQTEKGVAAIIASTPLVNGHALAVAFLGKHSKCRLCDSYVSSDRMSGKQWRSTT